MKTPCEHCGTPCATHDDCPQCGAVSAPLHREALPPIRTWASATADGPLTVEASSREEAERLVYEASLSSEWPGDYNFPLREVA